MLSLRQQWEFVLYRALEAVSMAPQVQFQSWFNPNPPLNMIWIKFCELVMLKVRQLGVIKQGSIEEP